VADQLGWDLQIDPESRRTLDNAGRTLASLREEKGFKRDEQKFALLSQKVQEADRKYEEAEVRDQKGEPEAERLYREAIALRETRATIGADCSKRRAKSSTMLHRPKNSATLCPLSNCVRHGTTNAYEYN